MLDSLRHQLFAPRAALVSLAQWRERVLAGILLAALLLGGSSAVPGIYYAIQAQRWGIVLIDIVALGWLALLWRGNGLRYRNRAWQLTLVLYALGLWFLFEVGAISQIYLLACPVLAALLLGVWPAVFWLLLTSATLPLLGYFGELNLNMPGLEGDRVGAWLLVGSNFAMINAALTLSSAVLIDGLRKSLQIQQAIARSLAEQQTQLETANEALRLTGAAVAQLQDIVLIISATPGADGQRPIVFANAALERQVGYRVDEVLGQGLRRFHGPATSQLELARLYGACDSREALRSELQVYRRNGEAFWIELDLTPLYDPSGQCSHFVLVQRDISARKQAEDDIHRLAFYDALTGLPNRRLLQDRLEQALASCRRSGSVGALIYIDLDHFKQVNDGRGHATGDQLLRQVALRLAAVVREADSVARLGGDEFVVLLSRLGDEHAGAAALAMRIADKLRKALAEPLRINGQDHSGGGSLGITVFPKPGQHADDVLREADMAMYRAKAGGRQRVVFFEAAMQAEIEEKLAIQQWLAEAFSEQQLALHLQPQVNAAGLAVGGELLLRWHHPQHGNIAPARFIPVAEETGLIVALGNWVLAESCRLLGRQQKQGRLLPLSVNVSPHQFQQADFVEQVLAALDAGDAPANLLVLEVTEGLLIRNVADTVAKMSRLAALGVRFSIDDFGTGYSSFAYLKRLPLAELKIDRVFIQDLADNDSDQAIVAMMLGMAAHLGLRVVAEGVETEAQARFLIGHGCQAMQGYWFARPMPLDEWQALPADSRFPRPAGLADSTG